MIQDYSELVAEVTERSGISDVPNRARTLLGMAEKMLSKRLRMSDMECLVKLTTDNEGLVHLPEDYSEMRFLCVGTETLPRKPLNFLVQGFGKGYATQGRRLRSSFRLTEHICSYFAALPSLEKRGSNWLLETEPEIYLHAFLFQVYTACDQLEKASLTASYLATLIDEANRADFMKRRVGLMISLGSRIP